MPSILIAEDHSVVRLGTMVLIRQLYADAVITEAETFDQALELLSAEKFDLLLMDIHLPGGDNLQMVEAVLLRQPDISILVFSSYEEALYARRYIQAGAQGYLQKDAEPEEVKKAISLALNKERYVSDDLRKKLLNELLDSKLKKDSVDTLSNRELEVMTLLIKGMTASEIKDELRLKHSTVSTYKERIFEKMGVNNIVELVNKLKTLERKN